MQRRTGLVKSVFSAAALFVLIIDGKTALSAGLEAVDLCMRVLIPSLFPFFVISALLTGSNSGLSKLFLPLRRLLRLPKGTETILMVGFLGGYPVGAAAIGEYVRSGSLPKEQARRMMAFCSNAGPSFLFGIGAQLFPSVWFCWLLWLVHILSALLVGALTPGVGGKMEKREITPITLTAALQKGIKVMATVCGWVILFRIMIRFIERWFLRAANEPIKIAISGILELANGCCQLGSISTAGFQFILFSAFIGFGGFCVWLQTRSVAEGVDLSLYLPGKLTQTAISVLLSTMSQVLLPCEWRYIPPLWVLLIAAAVCVFYPMILAKNEKRCGNPCAVSV